MGTNILKNFGKTKLIFFLFYSILGIPLLVAGIIKFINPSDFASSLKYSFYFPDWLSILIAIIIPLTEIIIGASLILNLYRHISIIIYRLLLICFLVFHIWNNFISEQKPCNCFGSIVEFNGIWMMIFILVLLIISFIPLKFQEGKKFFSPIPLKFSKRNIILVVSVVILIFAGGYVRWLRIERELNTGLLSSKNSVLINEKIKQLFNDYKFDNCRYKIVLFLKSPTCGDCIQQLLFWNSPKYLEKFSIIGIFSDKIDLNLSVIKNYYNLGFDLRKISYELWKQMVGITLPFSGVLLLNKDNTFVDYIILLKMEELMNYVKKIENVT